MEDEAELALAQRNRRKEAYQLALAQYSRKGWARMAQSRLAQTSVSLDAAAELAQFDEWKFAKEYNMCIK